MIHMNLFFFFEWFIDIYLFGWISQNLYIKKASQIPYITNLK